MGHVLTVLNLKGGVGKTTVTANLMGAWSKLGRHVLGIDCDPQGSLSKGICGVLATQTLPVEQTVAALFDDRLDPDPLSLIRPVSYVLTRGKTTVPRRKPGAIPEGRVGLVPGSIHLCNTTEYLGAGDKQTRLRDFVSEVRAEWDMILIDTPPTLQLASWSALVASDALLIPVQPEEYGLHGLALVQQFADQARQCLNPGLRLLGFLLTMVDTRLGVHTAGAQELVSSYGPLVFSQPVPRAKHFLESLMARLPVTYSSPRCVAAKQMLAVAEEVLARLEAPPVVQPVAPQEPQEMEGRAA